MSYTALYRKFRPDNFEDVKGQDHIVTTLKNQIKADRAGHAYLFCGTRGTGKTSVAKLLARAVNCENPNDGSPCNVCAMCRSIRSQTSMNVIEIDAASNNGVDNIREIVDEVRYSPTEGRYKVYIIDEVHMLSAGAFNALLKTLEEPPSYVIFILATTEVHKIPITILSRCQRYDFKRITVDVIAARLQTLMEQEQVNAEEKAIRYVAKAADGSMRDALSLLDQCIAFYFGERLTYDKVLDVLGAVDVEVFMRFFEYICGGEIVKCIQLLDKIIMEGRELSQFITDFTWYLRNMLLIRTSEASADMIDLSTEQLDILREEAGKTETDTLLRYIRIFSELSGQVKYAVQKRVLTEIALVKLCRPQMETNLDSILDRIRILEKRLESGDVTVSAANSASGYAEKSQEVGTPEVKQPPYTPAVMEDIRALAENWGRIQNDVSPSVRAMLNGAKPSAGEDGSLILVFRDETQRAYIAREEHLEEIKRAACSRIKKAVAVRTRLDNQPNDVGNSLPDITTMFNMEVEMED